MVHCKFYFDVWRWTGRWQKSNGCENRPTPGMLFCQIPGVPFCLHVPFCPTCYIFKKCRKWQECRKWCPLIIQKLFIWIIRFCLINLQHQWTLLVCKLYTLIAKMFWGRKHLNQIWTQNYKKNSSPHNRIMTIRAKMQLRGRNSNIKWGREFWLNETF